MAGAPLKDMQKVGALQGLFKAFHTNTDLVLFCDFQVDSYFCFGIGRPVSTSR